MSESGSTWAAFVEQELKAERDRRAAIDSRGQAVVTTSGSLVTLLVAVGAFVTGQDDFELPHDAFWPLIATLGLFAAAAFCGILATINRTYRVADRPTLDAIPQHGGDTAAVAIKNITYLNVQTVKTMRSGNNAKTASLLVALFLQLAAVLTLAATIILALTRT